MKYLLLFTCLLFSFPAFSQTGLYWSQPIPVANGTVFDNERPRIALVEDGTRPLVTWGRAIGGRKAYVARWDSAGFDTPILLNSGGNVNASSFESSEVVSRGDTVYAVFTTYPISTIKVRCQSSFDGGQTWSDPVWVDSLLVDIPTFANVTIAPDGNPIVMYLRQQSNWLDPHYVLRRSTDYGQTWLPEVEVSALAPGNEVCDCCAGELGFGGDKLVAIFRDNDNNLRDHWATVSLDSGQTFTSAIDVDTIDWTVPVCPTAGPSLHISGDSLFSTFYSAGGPQGLARVYMSAAHLGTGQLAWNKEIDSSTPSSITQNRPMISGYQDTIGVVWTQNDGGDQDIYLAYSTNGTTELWSNYRWNATGFAAGIQTDADLAFAHGVFHLVWSDQSTGNVMYRTATIGPPVGTIDPNLGGMKITAWPQPATEAINISITGVSGQELQGTWYDLEGKVVREEVLTAGENALQRKDLAPGIYFLKVTDPIAQTSQVKRISWVGK